MIPELDLEREVKTVMLMQVDTEPYVMFVYWAAVIVGVAIVALILWGMWRNVLIRMEAADMRLRPQPGELITKVAITALLGLAAVGLAAYGYSVTLVVTAPTPTPANVELETNLLNARLHEDVAPEVLAEQKKKIQEEQYKKPHEAAMSSFEKRMAAEAEKIKERNPELQK